MILWIILATVKDWADLAHAIAWPAVALIGFCLFRKIIDEAVRDILRRMPFERASSLRIPGAAEMRFGPKAKELQAARKARIPVGKPPEDRELLGPTSSEETI